MKLHKSLLLFGASVLLLTGCGDNGEKTEGKARTEEPELEEVTDEEVGNTEDIQNEEKEAIDSDSPEQQVGDVIEADGGTRTIIATNYGINETIENGPFSVTLKNAQLSQFQPTTDYVEMFGGDNLGMVSIQVDVVNDSEDTNSIYPDQAIIVTDTGQQIDAETLFSDEVGGDFYGHVTKSGDVFFFFDGQAEDVSNIRLIIDSGYDEDFNSFGEDLEFSFDF